MGDRATVKKVGTVTASISRNAGGLFESVRKLTISIAEHESFENVVFSLEDKYTRADEAAWIPLSVKVVDVLGPRRFGFAPDLYRELANADLDVIHNHGIWMYPSIAVKRLAHDRSIPYVVSAHGMLDPWALANSRWKKRVAESCYERRHLSGAACLRALCEAEADAMRAFGLKNPICVIPNGIDLPPEKPGGPAPWANLVPAGKKILLYLGRIHPKKGLTDLLRAWDKLLKSPSSRGAEWHFVVAGWDEGGHQERLMALARMLGISSSVAFVGPQFGDAKRATYSAADAFILPSLSEGLPMVVLEAWSYRLPVLMTPACNLPEGFEAEAALEIRPEIENIAEGLNMLLSLSDSERESMGMRGQDLVRSKFRWHRIGAEMARVYEWILGGGAPPASIRQ